MKEKLRIRFFEDSSVHRQSSEESWLIKSMTKGIFLGFSVSFAVVVLTKLTVYILFEFNCREFEEKQNTEVTVEITT